MSNNGITSLPGGPLAVGLAESLKRQIAAGQFSTGEFLPSVRKLSAESRLAHKTVFHALKNLAAQGWVVAEAGRGYRVLAKANDPDRGAPVAFVLTPQSGARVAWNSLQETLLSSFHRAVAERGWMLLGMDCGPIGHGEIVERLQNMKVCGTILDTSDPELIAIVQRAGTPVVVVENWHESLEVDAVVQDGFRGGYLAASWLAERGHERIGWIGPMELNRQGSERLGGAMAALAERGIELMPDLRLSLPEPETPGRLDLVEKYLARRNRPTGVLALWQGIANLVAESRRNLGLHFGRSFEMVGWSTEDAYESEFRSNFRGGPTPPAIVWDVNMLARVAVARLAERRADPKLPPLMLKIPTRLRIDSGETT